MKKLLTKFLWLAIVKRKLLQKQKSQKTLTVQPKLAVSIDINFGVFDAGTGSSMLYTLYMMVLPKLRQIN